MGNHYSFLIGYEAIQKNVALRKSGVVVDGPVDILYELVFVLA